MATKETITSLTEYANKNNWEETKCCRLFK